MGINRTSHTVYDLEYHFTWVPKRRRRVLRGVIKERIEGMIKYACQLHEFEIRELVVDEDHVHLYIGAKPKYSPSEIMNIIKGGTSRKIRKRYPDLDESVWRSSFWCDGYFVGSVGRRTKQSVKEYLANHDKRSKAPDS